MMDHLCLRFCLLHKIHHSTRSIYAAYNTKSQCSFMKIISANFDNSSIAKSDIFTFLQLNVTIFNLSLSANIILPKEFGTKGGLFY